MAALSKLAHDSTEDHYGFKSQLLCVQGWRRRPPLHLLLWLLRHTTPFDLAFGWRCRDVISHHNVIHHSEWMPSSLNKLVSELFIRPVLVQLFVEKNLIKYLTSKQHRRQELNSQPGGTISSVDLFYGVRSLPMDYLLHSLLLGNSLLSLTIQWLV